MSTNNIAYKPTVDGRCGPSYGNQTCINNTCCSIHGWCGGDQTANDKGIWCTTSRGFDGQYDAVILPTTSTPTVPEKSNALSMTLGIASSSCCSLIIIILIFYFMILQKN